MSHSVPIEEGMRVVTGYGAIARPKVSPGIRGVVIDWWRTTAMISVEHTLNPMRVPIDELKRESDGATLEAAPRHHPVSPMAILAQKVSRLLAKAGFSRSVWRQGYRGRNAGSYNVNGFSVAAEEERLSVLVYHHFDTPTSKSLCPVDRASALKAALASYRTALESAGLQAREVSRSVLCVRASNWKGP